MSNAVFNLNENIYFPRLQESENIEDLANKDTYNYNSFQLG